MHGERREDVAVFRHITNAQVGDLVGLLPGDAPAFPVDVAFALHQAHDGLGRGGPAGTVAPQQGHNFTGLDLEVDTVQHMALAVIGVEVFYFEHVQCPPAWESATAEPR